MCTSTWTICSWYVHSDMQGSSEKWSKLRSCDLKVRLTLSRRLPHMTARPSFCPFWPRNLSSPSQPLSLSPSHSLPATYMSLFCSSVFTSPSSSTPFCHFVSPSKGRLVDLFCGWIIDRCSLKIFVHTFILTSPLYLIKSAFKIPGKQLSFSNLFVMDSVLKKIIPHALKLLIASIRQKTTWMQDKNVQSSWFGESLLELFSHGQNVTGQSMSIDSRKGLPI